MVVAKPVGVVAPDAQLSQAARAARDIVADAVQRGAGGETIVLECVVLPSPVAHLLRQILDDLVRGYGVTVHTIESGEEEVSTSKAARILGMSRPTLIDLLEKGHIPFRKVGTHRRVPLLDLLTYKMGMQRGPAPSRAEKLRALEEMADYTDRLGLGY